MEFVNVQNKRYVVKYKAPDTGYSPEKLSWIKWYRQSDLVLKKNDVLYFVEEMPEIKFEEITENS